MNDRQAHINHFEQRTHRVQPVIAPSRGNSSGSKAVDFATFWQIRLPLWLGRVDWAWIGVIACAAVMVVGIVGTADSLDWINVAALFGSKS